MVFEKVLGFLCQLLKKCHYSSEGDRYDKPRKGGMEAVERENTQELIGILQAISIVAKSLAVKLMQIEKSVQAYESGAAAVAGGRKAKKGWKW